MLIPKCIDRTLYNRQPLASRERAILHAGTLPYKNPVASVRAFAALNDQTVRLYITGEVTAPLKQALDALPKHLRACVTLMGEADGQTVRALHGRVRIASFPTWYAVPVASATVMEAVAAGTPIVGSSSLSRDVLTDGVNGLVVGTRPEDMAASFRSVLDQDLLWSRLSDGAGQLIERFDAHRVAKQYLALVPVHQRQPAQLNIRQDPGARPATDLQEVTTTRGERHDRRILPGRHTGTGIISRHTKSGPGSCRCAGLFH
jgi:glycosyltransferase involved in cell wall biosynthesis